MTATAPQLALNARQAAEALGMSLTSFKRHVQPGLRCVYVGRLRLYRVGELERWLGEQGCENGRAAGGKHCDFCKGQPVGNAASWLDDKPRPPAACPRCGETNYPKDDKCDS